MKGGTILKTSDKIIDLRSRRGWSQAKLADVAGIPQTTISGIENDAKIPNLTTAAKLAAVFGIHAEELLSEEVKN